MRELIYVPIVHNFADMGQKKDILPGVDRFWDVVEEELAKLDLNYKILRIYNDSVSPERLKSGFWKNLSKKGSRNFRLVERYIDRGAILEGAEEDILLYFPYSFIKLFARTRWETDFIYEIRKKLLTTFYKNFWFLWSWDSNVKYRDVMIAKNIDASLKEGEVGLLLIGALHNPLKYLSPNIKVIHIPKVELELVRLWGKELGLFIKGLL